jgi:hypothetical protein
MDELLRMVLIAAGLLWAAGAHAAVVGGSDVNWRVARRTNAQVVGTLWREEEVSVVSAPGGVEPRRSAASPGMLGAKLRACLVSGCVWRGACVGSRGKDAGQSESRSFVCAWSWHLSRLQEFARGAIQALEHAPQPIPGAV